MRPVSLNLASRPFRNNTVVGSVLVAATVALVLATVYNLYVFLNYGNSYAELLRQQEDDRTHLTALEVEERTLLQEVKKRDFRHVREQGKLANDLILKRSFSWTLLFNTLEVVMPPDVMMRSIRPNVTAEGITVRVDGVAKNHGAFLDLETRLQGHAAFARVFPLTERKLNPSRPEIDFAMHFDYLPQRASTKDLVAKEAAAPPATAAAEPPASPPGAAVVPAPAAAPGPTATASGPAPAGSEPQGPRAPAAATTAATSTGVTRPDSPPFDLKSILGTVGRDGRPRTTEALARLLVAPGGVYLPLDRTRGDGRSSPGPGKGNSRSSRHAAGDKSAAATGPAPSRAAAQASSSVPAAAKAARPPGVPPPGDPNLPETLPASRRAMAEAQAAAAARAAANRPPVPAQRLDLPLAFVGQPVGIVYDTLAKAHGVVIELDSGVDRQAHVTADLKGKPLTQAILTVAGLAGHRVTRRKDGVYRVAPSTGGMPIVDPPVGEEDLKPAGAKP